MTVWYLGTSVVCRDLKHAGSFQEQKLTVLCEGKSGSLRFHMFETATT